VLPTLVHDLASRDAALDVLDRDPEWPHQGGQGSLLEMKLKWT
jgi:hypothetical protein